MDKNYNVDDILEEIKRRKSTERSGGNAPRKASRDFPERTRPQRPSAEVPPPAKRPASPPARKQDSGDTMHFSIPKRDLPPPSPKDHAPSAITDDDGFQLDIPPVEKVSRNPLDVDSGMTSLADRAKQRRRQNLTHSGQGAPTGAVSPTPPAGGGRIIDFSAFRTENADRAPAQTESNEYTRVIDRGELARSREFNLEEIRQMDFGAVAGEYDYDDYDDEEEVYIPSAPPLDHSEYNSTADRDAVARDLAKVKTWLIIRCLLTGVLTGVLYYVVWAGRNLNLLLPDIILPEEDMRMYMFAIVTLTVLVALVCSSAVGGGLISLFKMRANSDTLVSLALLAAIMQGVAGAVKPDSIDATAMGIYACVAALAMLFNTVGKLSTIGRIQKNFRIISSGHKKRAVLPVASEEFSRQFVHETGRRPTVAYSVPAGFPTDFLSISYSDQYEVGLNRSMAPACLIGAIVVGILTYLLTRSSATAMAAIAAILCVAATLSSTFIENIPLGKITSSLAPIGGVVSGTKAIETFCDAKAVILREKDLFPEGNIQLHGIKAYSHGRIDEAILDAASVLCATDSALSPIFLDMIGGNRKLLKKVDNLVYENGMGISAWVDSRRVLIGNQQLMLNHGVPLPQDSYGQKYADENGTPIYLSNSGEVSAQFIVSYHIDDELAVSLDHMAVNDMRLVVHTVDPNLTAYRLWELYGYPEDLIDIMPAEFHAHYDNMAASRDTAPAEMVYTGKAPAMVRAILACVGARSSILAASIIQLVQVVLGYGLITFVAFMGAMDTLNIIQLSLYQLFWFAAIFVVQKVRSI